MEQTQAKDSAPKGTKVLLHSFMQYEFRGRGDMKHRAIDRRSFVDAAWEINSRLERLNPFATICFLPPPTHGWGSMSMSSALSEHGDDSPVRQTARSPTSAGIPIQQSMLVDGGGAPAGSDSHTQGSKTRM